MNVRALCSARSSESFARVVLGLGAWVVVLSVASGCASTTQSMRALRQHAREDPKVEVVVDRIEDLEANVALAQRLLFETPYTPGAPWIQQLALDDARGDAIAQQLRQSPLYVDGQARVPVAKVMRVHIEQVLARAAPTEDGGGAAYPSVFAAVQDLVRQPDLEGRWGALKAKAAEEAEVRAEIRKLERERSAMSNQDARDSMTKRIMNRERKADNIEDELEDLEDAWRASWGGLDPTTASGSAAAGTALGDLITVLSTAARLDLEAAALIPVVSVQLYRTLAPSEVRADPAALKAYSALMMETAPRFGRVAVMLEQQSEAVLPMTEALCRLGAVELGATAGFMYGESASELIVGFALDSFYIDVKAGAEAYFFSVGDTVDNDPDEDTSTSGEDNDITYDYSGRQFVLEYQVEPIYMADVSLNAGFDLAGIAEFFNLDLDYKTDRVWRQGGSVETSSDALGELGVSSGVVSDVLGVGLSLVGVQGAVRIAKFNAGEVALRDLAQDQIIARVPLRIEFTQVDLSYNLIWLMRDGPLSTLFDAVNIGFRYMDYTLPRIVYEVEDTNGNPDVDNYVYKRESPAQPVDHVLYMGGIGLRRGLVAGSGTGFLFDLGLFGGAGPTRYTMTSGGSRTLQQLSGFTMDLKMGWAFGLYGDPTDRLQADLVVLYEFQMMYFSPNDPEESAPPDDRFLTDDAPTGEDSDLGEVQRTFGALDLFHGPKMRFRLTF